MARGAAALIQDLDQRGLLDEAPAHLDTARRAALFDEIEALGLQAFMTGTEAELFAPLRGRAQFVRVEGGCFA